MSLFPIFLKLAARPCVVIGAGTIAESKIESLLIAEARVTVIAPEALPRVQAWAAEGALTWHPREYAQGDLAGSFLAVAATNTPYGKSCCLRRSHCCRDTLQRRRRPTLLRLLLSLGRSSRRVTDRHLNRRRKPRTCSTVAQGTQRSATARHWRVAHGAGPPAPRDHSRGANW